LKRDLYRKILYPLISAALLLLISTSGILNSLDSGENTAGKIFDETVGKISVNSDFAAGYSPDGYYFEASGDPLLAVIPHRISGGVPTITVTEPCPTSASGNRSIRFSIFPVFTENKIISAHRSYLKQRGGNELAFTLSDKYQLPVLLRKIII